MLIILTAGSTLPDQKLTLKTDFPMVLPRNINPFRGHFKDMRYVLKALHRSLLLLKSLRGYNAVTTLTLPTMPCDAGDSNFPI